MTVSRQISVELVSHSWRIAINIVSSYCWINGATRRAGRRRGFYSLPYKAIRDIILKCLCHLDEGRNVLLHCLHGKHRSGVLAVLIMGLVHGRLSHFVLAIGV